VVLKQVTKDDSAPLKYKGAVPFAGGSAALKYSTMKTANIEPSKPTDPNNPNGPDVSAYVVTFDLNYTGAPNPPKPQEIDEGGKVTLPSPAPTREGYALDGWYKEAAGTTKWDFDKGTVTEDITLYAKWTQIFYTVTFFVDGVFYKAVDAAHGDKATPPTDIASKADHDLDGWYTATDYASKWNFDSPVIADITLYAKWKPLTLAAVITDMAADKDKPTAAYTLPSGNETYTTALNLTTANSPASVTIDGGNRVVTGSTNSITVGAGITLTLKNISFTTLPFSVAAGGTLVLGNEGDAANSTVVSGNAGTGITVNGGTLELKAGALVKDNHDSGIVLENNSVLTMTSGEISGNTSVHHSLAAGTSGNAYGGGVRLSRGVSFTMNGGEISDNTSEGRGGGIYIYGANIVFHMTGGVIRNNTAVSGGGGLFLSSTTTFTGNPTIGGTSAPASGGWIHDNEPNEVGY
jgi:uncharacterized repeat protein (TIGR02543 family)